MKKIMYLFILEDQAQVINVKEINRYFTSCELSSKYYKMIIDRLENENNNKIDNKYKLIKSKIESLQSNISNFLEKTDCPGYQKLKIQDKEPYSKHSVFLVEINKFKLMYIRLIFPPYIQT